MTTNRTTLKIFILEDDATFLRFIEKTLNNYIMIEELHAEIKIATQSATDLLNAIDLQQINDSFFLLDIDIPGSSINSIDIANIVRKHSLYADIMFITSHTEQALTILSQKILPLDLVDKSVPAEVETRLRTNLVQGIKRLRSRQLESPRLFSYQIGANLFSLPLDDVLYIQTVLGTPSTLELHAKHETTTFPGNLKEVTSRYPTLFRCHRSFLLNPLHVHKLNASGRFVYMDNQDKLDVSIRKVSALRRLMGAANRSHAEANNLADDA